MVVEATRRRGWACAGVAGLAVVVMLGQAALKLLWVDELITFYIARQPGLAGIWRALATGADPNPPLMHVLVKASTAIFGGNSVGMRVPSMAAVLLAVAALWWMLSRWIGTTYVCVGVLAFMATRGFDYAYDARSYGLLMGFGMASLACWMYANQSGGGKRSAALGGMAFMLAAGVSSNYYGVLAFFPIAVGEVVTRRRRPGVWVGMAVASLPLLAYLPLIRHNIAEFGPHAWNRPRLSMVGWSYVELVEGVFWPVLALGLWAAWKRLRPEGIAPAEMAAVGVLLVYPVLGYAIAVSGAGMISPRCVTPVCCGFGLAAGVLAQRLLGRYRRAGVAMVAVLVLWVVVREGVCAGLLLEQRRAFLALRDDVARQAESGQILVADTSFVLPLAFYSKEDVRRRIVAPIDFAAIHRMEKDDSGEENLWAGREGLWPIKVARFGEVRVAPGDVVIAREGGWLAESVRGRGFRLEEVPGGEWDRLGGVFTPMGHEGTRMFRMCQESC